MSDLEAYCEKVMAKALVSTAIEREIESWDYYPDLGEFTWERIVNLAAEAIPDVRISEMHAAYNYLSMLANDVEF